MTQRFYSGKTELSSIAATIYAQETLNPEREAMFEQAIATKKGNELFGIAFMFGVEAALFAIQNGQLKMAGRG